MSRNDLIELMLGREISIRFVSVAEAVALHDRSIQTIGGIPGVRDLDLLESALHKPMQKCAYEEDTDLFSLAATLADGIAQNHSFLDGNKRTAFLSCVRFLAKNDITFSPDAAEGVEMFRKLASHELDAASLAQWIRETVEGENNLAKLAATAVAAPTPQTGSATPAPTQHRPPGRRM